MTISQLVFALDDVVRLYGEATPVRVDLGRETEQRAFDVSYAMAATFPHEDNKVCIVIFTDWRQGGEDRHERRTVNAAQLAKELTLFYNLMGDTSVRIDMGFETEGRCYEIEHLALGEFPNEGKRALVLYPTSRIATINVQ